MCALILSLSSCIPSWGSAALHVLEVLPSGQEWLGPCEDTALWHPSADLFIAVILRSAPSHWLCIDFLDFILCLLIQSSAVDKEPGITTSNPAVSTGLVLYLLEFWSSPRGSRSAALKILDSSHLPCLAHITKLFPSGRALGSCWMEQSQAMNLSCWWAFSPWSYTPK